MKNKKILILMIIFAVTTAGLGVWLGVTYNKKQIYGKELENGYQQSYFELVSNIEDMKTDFSKLLVSESSLTQRKLLLRIWKASEVNSNCLSSLSSRDGSVSDAIKFTNQMSDYCYRKAMELEDGGTLDEEAINTLGTMKTILFSLSDELGKIRNEIGNGYLFLENFGDQNDVLTITLSNLNGGSVEYPQLIYDGPFSDSLSDKEIKYTLGEEVEENVAREKIGNLLSGYTVTEINFLGEWDADICSYAYSVSVEGSETPFTIQLTKNGARLLELSGFSAVDNPVLSDDECAAAAVAYAAEVGYENMSSVWVYNSNSTVYVNLAPVVNNVIYYPDLIKVKVSSENGAILGFQAANYIFNHADRQFESAVLTEVDARQKVNSKLNVGKGRLALIPLDNNSEVLTYEFVGESEGIYYVYINAVTGEEENILYVIESEGGNLLM